MRPGPCSRFVSRPTIFSIFTHLLLSPCYSFHPSSAGLQALIDNAPALGYTNVTGFSTSYPILWGGPYQPPLNNNTQVERLLPQGSYFWLDNLHPNWAVHGVLAHAVGTFLGGVNVVGGQ